MRKPTLAFFIYFSCFLLVPVGALLPVLGFLACRTASVCTGDIFLFLGLGLHFAIVVLFRSAAAFEDHAAHDNIVDIAHICKAIEFFTLLSSLFTLRSSLFSGGTNERG